MNHPVRGHPDRVEVRWTRRTGTGGASSSMPGQPLEPTDSTPPTGPDAAPDVEPDAAAEPATSGEVAATSQLVVHHAGDITRRAPAWRERALAVRESVPRLVRNPAVIGVAAAVGTIAGQLALEVAKHYLAQPPAAQRSQAVGPAPVTAVSITGRIVHHVHVVHHVQVVHTSADPLRLPPSSR
jgi:hypothetical protein